MMKNNIQEPTIDTVLANYLDDGQNKLDDLPIFLQHYSDQQLMCYGTGLECLVAVIGGGSNHKLLARLYGEINTRATKN